MDDKMRKPRDYDAELKALEAKAKELKARKVQQLGELVIATGADNFSTDELADALVALAEITDTGKREAWARRGEAFFRGKSQRSAKAVVRDTDRAQTQPVGASSPSGGPGTA